MWWLLLSLACTRDPAPADTGLTGSATDTDVADTDLPDTDTDGTTTADTDTDVTDTDVTDTGPTDTGTTDTGVAPCVDCVPDFSLADINPNSLRYTQPVSPRDYLEKVSGWAFLHAT
jgi:hypothetical protein